MTGTKYSALEEALKKHREDQVVMTFSEIERIIGSKLPESAFKHRAWWSNNPSNSVITVAWKNAGFETAQVEMEAHRLVFRRIGARKADRIAAVAPKQPQPPEKGRSYTIDLRHPLLGALKGTIRIAPGTNLSEPADPEWGGE